MIEEELFNHLNFTEPNFNTLYDYLKSLIKTLTRETTHADIWMDYEVKKAVTSGRQGREVTLYTLVIVAPRLKNMRREIIYISEFADQGFFPVNIGCYLDDSFTLNVTKENLHSAIIEIFSRSIVKNSIEKLYRLSLKARS